MTGRHVDHIRLPMEMAIIVEREEFIEYKGHKYELWTCCQACADNMKKMAKNEKEFTKKYVHGMEGTTLLAKNQHTGVMVQKLHRVE